MDDSGGEHNGRVYLIYTDAEAPATDEEPAQTQLYLRYSDDSGTTWSDAIDVPGTKETNTFLPAIAVDQATGTVGVGWYGTAADGSSFRYKTTVSDDGGQTWAHDTIVVAPGNSTDIALGPGQYTGLTFAGGILQAAWTDDSKQLDGNPDLQHYDVANARVGIATVNGPPLAVTPAAPLAGTAGTPLEDTVLATFTDPTPHTLGQYAATINWGDGSARTRAPSRSKPTAVLP